MAHSRVYREIEIMNINPPEAKSAALADIERMETDDEYAKKVNFSMLHHRIQFAFYWDQTPDDVRKLWPQLAEIQFKPKPIIKV